MTPASFDSKRISWVPVPDGSDFPIQNLPFGMVATPEGPRAVVAIGDFILDLNVLQEAGYFPESMPPGVFKQPTLNTFFETGRPGISKIRNRVMELLTAGNEELDGMLRNRMLIDRKSATMLKPVAIPNYTDFYSSEEHATNVGSMFRDPKNALLPNWKHLPVAYHGRASSIVVSGTPIHRPKGQVLPKGSDLPVYMPTAKLDYELELAFIACGNTQLGQSIPTAKAEEYIGGLVLFNDWSARDIQQWEYVPLGPFLGKNFGSTLSPWVVTLDALEAFRVAGPEQFPSVLPYLRTAEAANFDIRLEVLFKPKNSSTSFTVCRTNFKYLYWSMRQQLAHHTINGCNVEVGDLYASGTISGPSPGSAGSLLELTWNGERPLHLGTEERTFIQDGDEITITGYAEKDGIRIGFGEATGLILPAI